MIVTILKIISYINKSLIIYFIINGYILKLIGTRLKSIFINKIKIYFIRMIKINYVII